MQDTRDRDGEPLESWKEIAAYFRRDVRTVQRWERDEGLPIHRDGGKRGRVWARRAELQAWWSHAEADAAGTHQAPDDVQGGRLGMRVARVAAAVLLAAATLSASRLLYEWRRAGGHAGGSFVVDVRPFQEPNVVIPGGMLAVALIAPASLLDQLDLPTLRAGGSAPREMRWQDFNSDGRTELWLYFDVSALALSPTATRLAVAGRTRDGRPVAGADDVIVLPGRGRSVTPAGLR